MILRPGVALAMAKAHSPGDFVRLARGTDSHQVVVAASFGVRFSPALDPSAALPSAVCRCPIRFATAGFVPAAAGPFDLAVAVVAGFSAADLSVVAADPGSAGPDVVAVASDFACSAYFSAAELGKEKAVALVSCFLTRRSSF